MRNKKPYLIFAAVLVIVIGFVFWSLKQPKEAAAPAETEIAGKENDSAEIIYFYGQECPHCQKVSQFLEENKIAEKVKFSKKEVWHNKENNAELQKRVAECRLDPKQIGVPFLYARGRCLIGGPDVESFFRQEVGI